MHLAPGFLTQMGTEETVGTFLYWESVVTPGREVTLQLICTCTV